MTDAAQKTRGERETADRGRVYRETASFPLARRVRLPRPPESHVLVHVSIGRRRLGASAY